MRLLYEWLYETKAMHGKVFDESAILLVERTQSIAVKYRTARIGFGTKLENAADNLYMFVSHLGMYPTNNESENAT